MGDNSVNPPALKKYIESTTSLNIGTTASAGTITIGNGTGASSLVLQAGTGAINIGANGVARTTTIGNDTGTSALILKSGSAGITTIGNTYLDDGTAARSTAIPSATIATFLAGEDLSSALLVGCAVVVNSVNMSVVKADGSSGSADNIVGILASAAAQGSPVQVQIGGIMLAKFSTTNTSGNTVAVAATGFLTDTATTAAGANVRFITVRAGTINTNDSLVIWLRGESY